MKVFYVPFYSVCFFEWWEVIVWNVGSNSMPRVLQWSDTTIFCGQFPIFITLEINIENVSYWELRSD